MRTLPQWLARDHVIRREDAEHFIEEVRGDDPEVAAKLRIEERELDAGVPREALYFCAGDQANTVSCPRGFRVRLRCPLPSAFMT